MRERAARPAAAAACWVVLARVLTLFRPSLAVTMPTQPQSLEFRVQGSAVEPYTVRFWREGANLRSTCSCQAGARGLACKHRLNLLEGDVTQVVSGITSDVQRLRELCAGSDVESALSAYEREVGAPDLGLKLLPLKPPGRRKSIATEVASAALAGGGLAKGNTSYFDVYDLQLNYIGSLKVRKGTVFSECPDDYFQNDRLTSKRIVDGLVWERSQSVFVTASHSAFANFLSNDEAHRNALRSLKKAVAD